MINKKEVEMFNALQYTKDLEELGFERDQADLLVRMFMQMIEFNMLSKSDFENFKSENKSDLEAFKSETRSNFEKHSSEFTLKLEKLRAEFKFEIEGFKQEVCHRFDRIDDKFNKFALQLTIKLGVMLALSVGILSTILAIKL